VLLVQAGDSLTDVLRVVSVLWLCNLSSTPKQTSCNHCLSSLSATRVGIHQGTSTSYTGGCLL